MKVLISFIVCCCWASFIQARIVHVTGTNRYSLGYSGAYLKCSSLGGSLATYEDLQKAMRHSRYSSCACGWLADKTARLPMLEAISGCGGRAGIHTCTWRNKWDAYCYLGEVLQGCARPLGIEMGSIPDHSMTSSTANNALFGGSWTAGNARLNRIGMINAWMPHHDGRNQYLEVDLGHLMAISGIITQGARRYLHPQYVTKFKLQYSKNRDAWTNYEENDVMKIFDGNHDNNGHVRNMFSEVILARYIRFYPIKWHRHITVRLELLGCDLATYDSAMEEQRESSMSIEVERLK